MLTLALIWLYENLNKSTLPLATWDCQFPLLKLLAKFRTPKLVEPITVFHVTKDRHIQCCHIVFLDHLGKSFHEVPHLRVAVDHHQSSRVWKGDSVLKGTIAVSPSNFKSDLGIISEHDLVYDLSNYYDESPKFHPDTNADITNCSAASLPSWEYFGAPWGTEVAPGSAVLPTSSMTIIALAGICLASPTVLRRRFSALSFHSHCSLATSRVDWWGLMNLPEYAIGL